MSNFPKTWLRSWRLAWQHSKVRRRWRSEVASGGHDLDESWIRESFQSDEKSEYHDSSGNTIKKLPDVVELRLYVTAPVATAEDTPTPWQRLAFPRLHMCSLTVTPSGCGETCGEVHTPSLCRTSYIHTSDIQTFKTFKAVSEAQFRERSST